MKIGFLNHENIVFLAKIFSKEFHFSNNEWQRPRHVY